MTASRIAPSDWENPQWDEGGHVHNWKTYAGERLREVWPSFSDNQKKAVSASLDDVAASEEWD